MQLRWIAGLALATAVSASAALAQDRPAPEPSATPPEAVDPTVPAPDAEGTLTLEEFLAIYSTEDLNGDGLVDAADYDMWLAEPFLGAPASDIPVDAASPEAWLVSAWAADLNGDGATDEADYAEYVDRTAPAPAAGEDGGDANASPRTLTVEEWLEIYAVDLNEDGQIDGVDYQLWAENPFIGIPTAVASTSWGSIKRGARR